MASSKPSADSTQLAKGPLSVAAKLREQVALDATIQSDPKYKKYAQQVEKCLATFENMHDWPDFIAFLKQLLKTVQSYTQFKEIPRKLIVSKRLSQCLIPALPSGVHQRALDVYSHILSVLGPDGLKRDLPLWSSGLFPFFEYAATSVKPALLEIFEKYYLPLQDELRPVMRAFILSLLPGLEEETGEYFEKVMNLLDRLSGTVSPAFFLQNIWLVMLTTQAPRAYCLNYLSRRLPRLDSTEDITPIVGRDIGLMIRAFAAALSDDNILVQRGTLDLLLQSLRIESNAVKQASAADRTILMRAATGVVLRRDLSLNRRLFSWLLGPDENGSKQVEYYKMNSLGLLEETLRDEMFNPSSAYSVTRPFKIYVSLLDKWEIGAPLTEVLVYDALKSIKRLVCESADGGGEIVVTANTLYEAIEPRIIWKTLFRAVSVEISSSETQRENIDMLLFVMKTFRIDENEVQNIHLPLIFSAIVERLEEIARKDVRRITTITFRAGMELLDYIASQIPIASMTSPMQLTDIAFGGSFDDAAKAFYGLGENDTATPSELSDSLGVLREKRWSPAIPFIASFEHLTDLTSICVEATYDTISSPDHENPKTSCQDNWEVQTDSLAQGLSILLMLVDALRDNPPPAGPLTVSWDAKQWLDCVSKLLTSRICSFLIVDKVVCLAIRLHATSSIQPTSSIDDRQRLNAMMNALMGYLSPKASPYHVRAVNLIWEIVHTTAQPHMESIVAHALVSSSAEDGYNAYNAFGTLWRLSDDSQQPGIHFKVPMLIVLDTLKSDNPVLRRVGETWMRCNLKSYARVLDPIFLELLDHHIHYSATTTIVKGREIRGFTYDKPFDQHRIIYLLNVLLHVVRFGGHNFSRIANTTHISRTFSQQLVGRVLQAGLPLSDTTYMMILVETLLRFMQSEPKERFSVSMHHANIEMHAVVIDLLQSLVSRGDLDYLTIQTLESTVISKLFVLVHTQRLELQNKLLHILHSVVSASAASRSKQLGKGPEVTQQRSSELVAESGPNTAHLEPMATAMANPLLIQVLVDGIAVASNRPLLHHWLDFVLMTIPQFPNILTSAISSLNACICRQIRSALLDISTVLSLTGDPKKELISYVDDSELVMLLNALERLILLSLDEYDASVTDEISPTEKPTSDGAGLLSIVSNVFLTESQNPGNEALLTARSPAYRSLHEGIGVLYSTWGLVSKKLMETHPAYDTLALIFSRTNNRCRKAFEKLFHAHSFEVTESVIECWSIDQDKQKSEQVSFDIVDFLTSSAQNVVHMVCESISLRISPSNERRKQVLNPELTDGILFDFLEEYLSNLENPLAVQVWPRYLSLAKDIASNVKEYRPQVFSVLKCMTVLIHKLTQTTAVEDRRLRKDIQDTYGKLLEACVMMSGRIEMGIWPRRTKETLNVNGRDSPLSRAHSETNLSEKFNGSSDIHAETSRKPSSEVSDGFNQYLASEVLPNLRRFLVENDKIASACNNIVYYVLNPAFKARLSRITDVDDIFIQIIEQMSKIPAAVKAWRGPAVDVFNDSKFFTTTPTTGLKWRAIVKTIIDADKIAFSELLGRITSVPSANIFTNREYEMQMRAQNLRRLSFVIFASEKNHFLTQLPAVQEKMVDILRSGTAPIVESEVYLCIRVLLCRLSAHNLSSFWPVLLAEMIRIFEEIMAKPPSDGSDSLQVALSACKLIDLLLVLQTEEFQIHQWIFITDTVDAIYRPDDWFPEAIMDQLSETVGDLPATESRRTSGLALPDSTSADGLRQPLLRSVKQIDSIHDLAPFFSHLSIMAYEGVYASAGAVDWDAVERSLVEDMFDGK